MSFRKKLFSLLSAFLFSLLAVGVTSAQQPTPSDDEVNAIAKELYCPVCENIPLDVCGTAACAQWRELIRQKLSEGWKEEQIKEYFVQQYGARVIGTPNRLVYLIPFVAIFIGAYILYRAFRLWKRPFQASASQPPAPAPPTQTTLPQDEYINRLEEEVRKR
jgi:cytochrome c-type biogenesis protein CcmH